MTDRAAMSAERIALCAASEIVEGAAKGFLINDLSLFALRRDGEIYVYRNSCPHLGVELNWREDMFFDRDGELIQCALHGALFAPATGECLAGPCYGHYLQAIPRIVEADTLYIYV